MKKIKILLIAIAIMVSYGLSAQMAVTTDGSSADGSAMLEVKSSDKGLLIPNVTLTGTTDATTISTPAVSLLVYNTATVSDVTPGYYYNAGTTGSPVWTRFSSLVGTNPGQMQYWSGVAWITVPAGVEGQVLAFVSGIPTWKTIESNTDVTNPTTGKIWMDRNLGASRVARASDDYLAYGDLYQWGRAADGHELITWTSSTSGTPVSGTTSTLSSSDNPGHGNFIIAATDPFDWRSPKNDNLWQGISGTNNPCPNGYRVPTSTEWLAELGSWNSYDAAGAFASQLRLPVAGGRSHSNGSLYNMGSLGYYWASNVFGIYSYYLVFNNSNANRDYYRRACGYSVRCIKD